MNPNKWSTLSRRQFMSAAAKATLGVSLGTNYLLGKSDNLPKNEMKMIMLYMSGGMSHLDTFDLHPGSKENGPTKAIKSSIDGLQISSNLKELAPHLKHFAVINSMNTTQGAHEKGNYYMHTGYTQRSTIVHPTLGAWGMHHLGKINPKIPGNIVINSNSKYPFGGFLPPELGALPIESPSTGLQNSRIPDWHPRKAHR